MTIEGAIISFIVICSCFVFANMLLFPRNRRLERKISLRQHELEREVRQQLAQQTQAVDSSSAAGHITLLEKRLRRPYHLVAYAAALERVLKNVNPQDAYQYLHQAAPMFSGLCTVYEKKNEVYRTCYVHVLGQMLRCGMKPDAGLREFLHVQLHSESQICRQNAFSAICSAKDVTWVVKAVLYMNRLFVAYNDVYITEGLYRFGGNPEELADRLWEVYEELNNNFRLAVLNYLRLVSGRFCKEMLTVLEDPKANPKLHYAAIRYLGRYPAADAKQLLLRLLKGKVGESWAYASESALALGEYPGRDTFTALKKALFHPEWQVRMNASASLEKLGIDFLKLSDVINSNDQYAREIAQYRLEENEYRMAEKQGRTPKQSPEVAGALAQKGGV